MVLVNTLISALFCVGFNSSLGSSCEIYIDIDGIEYEEVYSDNNTTKDVILNLGSSFNFYYGDYDVEYETYLDTVSTEFTFSNIVRNTTINSFFVNYTLNSFGIFDNNILTFNYTENCTMNYSDRLGNYTRSISNIREYTFEYTGIRDLESSFTRDININLETIENSAYQDGYNNGYEDGYNDGEENGYLNGKEDGYNLGFIDGYNDGLADGNTENGIFAFLNGVFRAVDSFLSVEIIPNISLWAIVLIPIVFGVLAFFLNLWR